MEIIRLLHRLMFRQVTRNGLPVPFGGDRQDTCQIAYEVNRQAVACFGRRQYNPIDQRSQNGSRFRAAFVRMQRGKKISNLKLIAVGHIRMERTVSSFTSTRRRW
ncbi:hypothetical protein [Shinella sp. M27]|uniref:hypothetical protein n=1 Tax=Shinella sp. M27 TaxID=3368614 RepID=UPI003BA341D7